MPTRHQAGTTGHADGPRSIETRPALPFRGKAVDVRRLVLLVSIATEVAITHVINEDQYEVGTRSFAGQQGTQQEKRGEGEPKQGFLHKG